MVSRRQNVPNEFLFDIDRDARMTPTFLLLMSLSGVLAATAMLVNSVPILIGAMVVAPALPPLERIALGVVGGQPRSAWRGLGSILTGLGFAIVFAMLSTWLIQQFGVAASDGSLIQKPLLQERLRPGWYSVPVAVAAGIAGTLATVKHKIDTLVGVVAAVALVPAAAASGIALLSDFPQLAVGGFVLLIANLGIITGTSILVLTFAGQRIKAKPDEG